MRAMSRRWITVSSAAVVLAAGLYAPASALPSGIDPEPVFPEDGYTLVDPAPAVVDLSEEEILAEDTLAALPEQESDRVESFGPAGETACDNPYKKWVEITSRSNYHVASKWNGTSWKDGPGGTMVVKVEKAGKLHAEITSGMEVELGGVVAKAKAKVDAKIGAEFGITTGHEYRHNIPANLYGHLQYGSWGYKVSWVKYATSANRCGKVVLKRGSANLPTREMGWKWWTTKS